MPNLFSTMRSAATALDALQKSASASQNNVANATTPGYAKQRAVVAALPYDPGQKLSGGVEVTGLHSSRDEFAEQTVRQRTSQLAASMEESRQLSFLEGKFALGDTTGIAMRMDQLFTRFNSWSIAPLSVAEKTNVIEAAKNVALAFRETAQAFQEAAHNADVKIASVLSRISDLGERIRSHNAEVFAGGRGEAGSEATVNADLEELSQYVNVQALWQDDGTVTVLIGGSTPLVSGDRKFPFGTQPDPTPPAPDLGAATPEVRILDVSGVDVTRSMSSGQLGALLEFRNKTIPSLAGSVTQEGDLNRLAKAFADRVNDILSEGDPDKSLSQKMFTYTSKGAAAQSLSVPDSLTPATLIAADPSETPASTNGRAAKLAALSHPAQQKDMLDDLSYQSFFGNISSQIGRLSTEATQSVNSHRQLQAQALSVREQISGVSLDEEAVNLVTIQRAYEATSRMIAVIDELTKIAVNLGRN